MIPWQLGVQQNAAMYSHAHAWMQTFDCCCSCLNMHFPSFKSLFLVAYAWCSTAQISVPVARAAINVMETCCASGRHNNVTYSTVIKPEYCHIIPPHTALSRNHQEWPRTCTTCRATGHRSALTQHKSTARPADSCLVADMSSGSYMS